MSSRGGTTLYVTGFGHGTRARDLAYEFESQEPVYVHCRANVNAPHHPPPFAASCPVGGIKKSYTVPLQFGLRRSPSSLPPSYHMDVLFVATFLLLELQAAVLGTRFAFVEYESRRDADDAYFEMHGRRIGRDDILKIEWARTPPSASWRFEGGRDAPRRRSPRRGPQRSASPRRREPREDRGSPNGRPRERSRSPGGKEERDRDGDREMRSPRDERDRERDRERERDRDRDSRRDDRERDLTTETPPRHDDLDTADAE
ncbi:Pre-mRNA-splicing factor [Drechslerella dactyloides]|uniref:Pre-mRNA-splicing factor n=1 Tax=Drechslerella dactyloides TaxID=74499 RepID=A0AAD6NJR5_DREDA|nr:Pre-mRNA-splicing factor [Drechslerella dactyloides]